MSDAAVLAPGRSRLATHEPAATDLQALVEQLRSGRGLAHKRDIDAVVSTLARSLPGFDAAIAVGDDCAAIPDPASGGHLLFAIEGFVSDFVAAEPWFAGWCGVMVNVSDIAAMGGRPVAVIDALWSRDAAHAQPLLEGLAAAAAAYGVPIVGGHSNTRSAGEQLSVAILGRASDKLLTSFDAKPGDELLVAIDLRGQYHEPHPYWDASTTAPGERLRGDIELLAQIAEAGESRSAKDISMAGVVGTALMLLECSGVGATIDIEAIPRPPGLAADQLARWLMSFPSYGYVLAVAPANVAAVRRRFAVRDIACASVGRCDAGRRLQLRSGTEQALFWDLAQSPLIGCGPPT